MINAWVYWREAASGEHRFAELQGTDYSDTNPESWGLTKSDRILLVLQNAQFIGAWNCGKNLKRW